VAGGISTIDSGSFTRAHRGGSGSPLVCLHGITDTWRTWELVLDAFELEHEVLAPTLAGHAGGPPLGGPVDESTLADAVERAMDEAGFETADIVGNSLGGYVSLQLAARGRARRVVAFAPGGGWGPDDPSIKESLAYFPRMQELVRAAVPRVDSIVASPEGRRRATESITVNFEHIPAELIAHQVLGVAACEAVDPLVEYASRAGWPLEIEKIECPVRIVWGTEDRVLPWPRAAVRYREEGLAHADWVILDGVGHCPQLDVPLEASQLALEFIGP
jgi:pimeloyl-ACP methyl ester carboxylesterase